MSASWERRLGAWDFSVAWNGWGQWLFGFSCFNDGVDCFLHGAFGPFTVDLDRWEEG